MTYKEWTAIIEIVSGVVIGGWLISDILDSGIGGGTLAGVALHLLLVIGVVIVFNIAASIVIVILVSLIRREELKDEKADERDHVVVARGARNGYLVGSLGALAGLILLALGFEATTAAYALFASAMLAGITAAVSRLVYYRVG